MCDGVLASGHGGGKNELKSLKMIPFKKSEKKMNKNRNVSAFCFREFYTKMNVSNEREGRL